MIDYFVSIFWFILKPLPTLGSGSSKPSKVPHVCNMRAVFILCSPSSPRCLPSRCPAVLYGEQLLQGRQGKERAAGRGHRAPRTGPDWLQHEPRTVWLKPLCLSWGPCFWGFCFVLHLCCWKPLLWQRKKSVTWRSGSWIGKKVQGKFRGSDQTCVPRGCLARAYLAFSGNLRKCSELTILRITNLLGVFLLLFVWGFCLFCIGLFGFFF